MTPAEGHEGGDDEAQSTGQFRQYRDRSERDWNQRDRRSDDRRIEELERKIEDLEEKIAPVTTWFSNIAGAKWFLGSFGKVGSQILILMAVVAAAKAGLLGWLGINGSGGPPAPH